MRLLAICGSLQARSTNAALIDVAAVQIPPGSTLERAVSPADLPAFNPDLDGEATPAAVVAFRRQLAAADAVLLATPEYAHSLPGALKNALDWIVGSGELYGLPVAIVAGSPRSDGAALGRAALEQTLRAQGAEIVDSRTVAVSRQQLADGGDVGPDATAEVAAVITRLAAAVHPHPLEGA